jgi:hypothetical protein
MLVDETSELTLMRGGNGGNASTQTGVYGMRHKNLAADGVPVSERKRHVELVPLGGAEIGAEPHPFGGQFGDGAGSNLRSPSNGSLPDNPNPEEGPFEWCHGKLLLAVHLSGEHAIQCSIGVKGYELES